VAQSGLSKHQHVIIAGFGRTGQTCARFLKLEEIPFLALDLDPERVSEAKLAGSRWRSAMPAGATSCWRPVCCGRGW
jgi:CPA2 family monovalent cation:H+ antiporter-2